MFLPNDSPRTFIRISERMQKCYFGGIFFVKREFCGELQVKSKLGKVGGRGSRIPPVNIQLVNFVMGGGQNQQVYCLIDIRGYLMVPTMGKCSASLKLPVLFM